MLQVPVTVDVPAGGTGSILRGPVVRRPVTKESVEAADRLTRELVGASATQKLTPLQKQTGRLIDAFSHIVCDLLPCTEETISLTLANALGTNIAGAHAYLVAPFLTKLPGVPIPGLAMRMEASAVLVYGVEIDVAKKRLDIASLLAIQEQLPPERGAFGFKNITVVSINKAIERAIVEVQAKLDKQRR